MHEIVALLAPALVALGFYSHLHRHTLSAKKLLFSFGVFALFINLSNYLVQIYLLGHDSVSFQDRAFVLYLFISGVFAVIWPFVINLIENSIAIEVKKNDET